MVNHPAHYGGKDNVYEVIKVIEAWGLNFNLGTVVKYIPRAGKKDPAKTIEDLEKAKWYLQREIDNLKKIEADKAFNKAMDSVVKQAKTITVPAQVGPYPNTMWFQSNNCFGVANSTAFPVTFTNSWEIPNYENVHVSPTGDFEIKV